MREALVVHDEYLCGIGGCRAPEVPVSMTLPGRAGPLFKKVHPEDELEWIPRRQNFSAIVAR